MNTIDVRWKEEPFKDQAERIELEAGLSLSEIREYLGANEHTRFRLGDVLVDDLDFIPPPGSLVIAVQYPDDPFTIGAAIVSAFSLTSPYAVAAAYVVGFGVSIGGSLLLSKALAPKQKSLDGSGDSSGALLFSGGTNDLAPWQPVPMVLGTYRIVPPLAARPYTEVAGINQRIRSVVVVGMGDYELSDFKVGETPIENFSLFQTEVKKIGPGDRSLTLYPTDTSFQSVGRLLKDGYDPQGFAGVVDQHVVRTNTTEAVRLQATFLLPQGLQRFNENGKTRQHAFYLKVEYRRVGLPNWTAFYGTNASGELITGHATDARFITAAIDVPEGQYDVRATLSCGLPGAPTAYPPSRGGQGGDVSQLLTDCQWVDVVAFEPGDAVLQDNATVVAYYAGLEEQNNGDIRDFSMLATSKVPIINSDGTIGADSATSNPARLCRWLLTGEANARPIPAEKIDGTFFYQWQEYCETEGLEFNGLIDFETSLYNAFNMVARAGRGSHTMRDGKHSVVVDGLDLTTISQLFTPRNITRDSVELSRAYSEPKHGVIVRFPNRDKNFQGDEVVIYNDGFDANTATKVEGYDGLQGLTSYEQVYQHVRYELLEERLRPEVYRFRAPLDAVISTRGDNIRLTYPDLLIGVGGARVLATSGTDPITAIDLDEPLEMTNGVSYEVAIRNSANEHTTASVNNTAPSGETIYVSSLSLSTPLVSGTVAAGDLIAYGPVGATYVDLQLVSVEPHEDLTATLVGTNTAPEIFTTLDGETPPEFESVLVRTQGTDRYAPAVPLITSTAKRILGFGNTDEDAPRIAVDVFLQPGTGTASAVTSRYQCQWKPSQETISGTNPWRQLSDVPVAAGIASFEFESGDQEATFDFRAWAVSPKGVLSPEFVLIQNSKIIGDADPPTELEFTKTFKFLETGAQPVLRLDWQAPADPDTAARYLIRYSIEGQTRGQVYTSQTTYEIVGAVNGTYTVEIYTENVAKQLSVPLTGSYTFQASSPLEPLKVKGLEVDDGANGTQFSGPHAKITWREMSANLTDALDGGEFGDTADSGGRDPFIRDYRVRVTDPSTGAVLRTDYTAATEYIYSLDKNTLDGGPRRSITFEVRARDVNNQLSGPATITATNPAAAVPGAISVSSTVGAMFVSFTVPLDLDFQGILVWAHTSSDVPLDDDHLVCDGPLSPLSFTVEGSEPRWVVIAAYDEFAAGADFDPATLNLSPAIEIPSATLPPNSVDEAALQGNFDAANLIASGTLNNAAWDKLASPDGLTKVVGVIGTQAVGLQLVEEGHFKQIQAGYLGADAAFIKELTVNHLKIANDSATKLYEASASDFELFDGTDMDTWTTIVDIEDVDIVGQLPGESPVLVTFGFGAFVSSLNQSTAVTTAVGAAPVVQFRVVRDLGLGGETVVWTSDKQTVTSVGYGLGGGAAPLDSVSSGTYTYTLQGSWGFPNYAEGTARFSSTQLVDGTGTAWLSHLNASYEIRLPSITSTWFPINSIPGDTSITLEGAHGQGTTSFVAYETRIDSSEGPRISLDVLSPRIQILEYRR